jgi:hypothetical protein
LNVAISPARAAVARRPHLEPLMGDRPLFAPLGRFSEPGRYIARPSRRLSVNFVSMERAVRRRVGFLDAYFVGAAPITTTDAAILR